MRGYSSLDPGQQQCCRAVSKDQIAPALSLQSRVLSVKLLQLSHCCSMPMGSCSKFFSLSLAPERIFLVYVSNKKLPFSPLPMNSLTQTSSVKNFYHWQYCTSFSLRGIALFFAINQVCHGGKILSLTLYTAVPFFAWEAIEKYSVPILCIYFIIQTNVNH